MARKLAKRTPKRPNPDPVENNDPMPGEAEMAAAIDSIPFVPTPMPTMPDITGEGVGPLFTDKDVPEFDKDGKVKP
jgi:hypothetical protein